MTHQHPSHSRIRTALMLLSLGFMTSCSLIPIKSEISRDKRFANLLHHSVKTKDTLRLYKDYNPISKTDYCLTSHTIVDSKTLLIGTIHPSHEVVFERAFAMNSGGERQEWLEGSIDYKGQNYRIEYHLGFQGYGGNTGWRRIFQYFDVLDGQSN